MSGTEKLNNNANSNIDKSITGNAFTKYFRSLFQTYNYMCYTYSPVFVKLCYDKHFKEDTYKKILSINFQRVDSSKIQQSNVQNNDTSNNKSSENNKVISLKEDLKIQKEYTFPFAKSKNTQETSSTFWPSYEINTISDKEKYLCMSYFSNCYVSSIITMANFNMSVFFLYVSKLDPKYFRYLLKTRKSIKLALSLFFSNMVIMLFVGNTKIKYEEEVISSFSEQELKQYRNFFKIKI
mmetsp:Transcript_27897/g.29064  ORF Transcript_27897/g.29064 Transcript_27897/m.29064 type:complete len:238 (-) Transcript_27897:50-763(-)